MRNVVINSSINLINKKLNYNEEQLEIIKYGLEAIYILITKTIIIFTVAIMLNIFKEVIIFTLFYSLIRMFSFGLHATKSWICLVSSLITFLIIPYICNIIHISFYIKLVIGFILIILMYKNAPADTYKRPIIDKKRRIKYKLLSTFISTIMIIIALTINNNFISNALIFANILQNIMISKYTYKLFKLPYDNYKKYQNLV